MGGRGQFRWTVQLIYFWLPDCVVEIKYCESHGSTFHFNNMYVQAQATIARLFSAGVRDSGAPLASVTEAFKARLEITESDYRST